LENTIDELKHRMINEKQDLAEIESEMNGLKAKYELKKIEISQQNNKLDEKVKVLNEAKRAYTKIIESTTKLMDAVDQECQDSE
jgi:hypothetical protein